MSEGEGKRGERGIETFTQMEKGKVGGEGRGKRFGELIQSQIGERGRKRKTFKLTRHAKMDKRRGKSDRGLIFFAIKDEVGE